jgi:hypothetical protein
MTETSLRLALHLHVLGNVLAYVLFGIAAPLPQRGRNVVGTPPSEEYSVSCFGRSQRNFWERRGDQRQPSLRAIRGVFVTEMRREYGGCLALRPGFRPKARRPSIAALRGSGDDKSLGKQSSVAGPVAWQQSSIRLDR